MSVTPFVAARLEFTVRPSERPDVARRVAACLADPSLAPLQRVFVNRRSKESQHTTISAEVIEKFLLDRANHDVVLDSGRSGELVAKASVPTGEHTRGWDPGPATLHGHVVLPYDAGTNAERSAVIHDLAQALEVVYGAIAVEPVYGDAHTFVLVGRPRRPGLSPRHLKERRAHFLYDRKVIDEVPGPELGMYLGGGHLQKVGTDALKASCAFHEVKRLGERLVYLQLTADPADALRADYEDRLDAARAALAPLLMDLSKVTFS